MGTSYHGSGDRHTSLRHLLHATCEWTVRWLTRCSRSHNPHYCCWTWRCRAVKWTRSKKCHWSEMKAFQESSGLLCVLQTYLGDEGLGEGCQKWCGQWCIWSATKDCYRHSFVLKETLHPVVDGNMMGWDVLLIAWATYRHAATFLRQACWQTAYGATAVLFNSFQSVRAWARWCWQRMMFEVLVVDAMCTNHRLIALIAVHTVYI